MPKGENVTADKLKQLDRRLAGLLGVQFRSLVLPTVALEGFEPSQVGTIVGALMDALIPHLPGADKVGLRKAAGILGEREGYPDYTHDDGCRLELKLIYVDNPSLRMKRPPTRREPSARLTQKVTVKNVDPAWDVMLLVAYQLQPTAGRSDGMSPTVIDVRTFPMIELIAARDERLIRVSNGRWFGNYETPTVLSKWGRAKLRRGEPLDTTAYGRKESERRDYNEDTNFGKLARIPHLALSEFIKDCQAKSLGISKEQVDRLPQESEQPTLLQLPNTGSSVTIKEAD